MAKERNKIEQNDIQNINSKSNTEVLDTKEKKTDTSKRAAESKTKKEETRKEDTAKKESTRQTGIRKESTKKDNLKEEEKKRNTTQINKTQNAQKENSSAKNNQTEIRAAERKTEPEKEIRTDNNKEKKESARESFTQRENSNMSSENLKTIAINALKILLPIAACVLVIAVIISYVGNKNDEKTEESVPSTEAGTEVASPAAIQSDPLSENANANINELMDRFYTAMANGDMDTVRAIRDANDDTEIIAFQEKSQFIEFYENVNCYTKPGIEENSFFAYVTYDAKIKDIETKAPGLNAWYVYTAQDGSLKIDGDMEENILAAFKLVTIQDDVVDLYNKINVDYKNAIASDAALNDFMEQLPEQMKNSVEDALAQLGEQNAGEGDAEADTPNTDASQENVEQNTNQDVNQIVRATSTVNVRSSDSEEADRIGKVDLGTELTRVEERINGWSKVIFEGKEAYIKSDYLEVVTADTEQPENSADATTPTTNTSTGTTVVASTNVNVRNNPSQDADKIGTAQGGNSYELLEDQGEWFKINYNGQDGYVKSEFFE